MATATACLVSGTSSHGDCFTTTANSATLFAAASASPSFQCPCLLKPHHLLRPLHGIFLPCNPHQILHPTTRRFKHSLVALARDSQVDRLPQSTNLPFSFDLSNASSSSTSASSSSSSSSSSSLSSSSESHQGLVASATPKSDMQTSEGQEQNVDRVINAMIVIFAGSFAITKILTVDRDYWHGWTVFEILKYAPLHNWSAYEDALETNPLLAKMMISGIVYSIGDWFAQCYEGKPLLDINRERIFRSGLVGFCLHGSLSHFYYYLCEFLIPFKDWWGVPIKVAFDQTIWSGFWNSVYFVTLGILRLESPQSIVSELKATFWPMLSAGWKLWPFAHVITYGVIPVEQRLLWVDCVELIWVTILSMYSNEKSEARSVEGPSNSMDVSLAERTSKEEK